MVSGVYDTDLTDQQWAQIERLLPSPRPGGRPRTTNVRRVIDAIMYLLKTGCQWRNLPNDFPHRRTVYGYFDDWGKKGVWKNVQRKLYFATRELEGRHKYPSIAIIDSQSVRTGKMGGERGYDGGKKIKGRKRHIVVDSLGLPLAVTVTAANVHDLKGGYRVLRKVKQFLGWYSFEKLYADGTYIAKTFHEWVADKCEAVVVNSQSLAQVFKSFIPASQRWVVERSFAWFYDCRRLTIDYERTTRHSRFMLRFAAIRLMLNRLASPENGLVWA